MTPELQQLTEFLPTIGIPVTFGSLGRERRACFQTDVLVNFGSLHLGKRATFGAALHEAGHIAVTPAAKRRSLYGDIPSTFDDEQAVQGWAYAVCRHLNLSALMIFPDRVITGHPDWTDRTCMTLREGGAYLANLERRGLVDRDRWPKLKNWTAQ